MPVDCSGQAVLSYGAYMDVQDPSDQTWYGITGLTGWEGPQVTRGEIETTRLCSAAKEYALDLKDNGTFTANLQVLLGSQSQQILVNNMDSPNALNFRLYLPDDGYGAGEVTCGFQARVSGFPISGAQGQVITAAVSLRITGDLTWTFPDSAAPHLKWSAHALNESSANNGAVAGVISVIASNETFSGADGDDLAGVIFSGAPAGLTPKAIKVSDSTVYISFSGQAASHAAGDSAAVTVTFGDAAFAGGNASAVAKSQNQIIVINFI